MSILDDIQAASKAIDHNDLTQADRSIQAAEAQLPHVEAAQMPDMCANLGAVMIDLGARVGGQELLEKGSRLTIQAFEHLPDAAVWPGLYYNVANGCLGQWRIGAPASLKDGCLDDAFIQAKAYYRKALHASSQPHHVVPRDLYCQILVSYANCLDAVGRGVEAIPLYDRAIRLDPTMAQALGNKGVTLYHLAFLAAGHTHLFLSEARRLLREALQNESDAHAQAIFTRVLSRIDEIIGGHPEFETEHIDNEPAKSPFHEFLRDYCARNGLFLTPTALVGKHDALVFGDPMFISHMVAPLDDDTKFERYVTFLDQIKQDYVLARYLLVQSQHRSSIVDAIDAGVELYYPLDYSLHGTYVQMLKTSARLAVDILDKIANFIRDYCGLTSPSQRATNFRNIWPDRSSPHRLRPELASRQDKFMYALFDLSLDLDKNGHYGFVYDRRNALTHRYLAIHDMILTTRSNADIPRVTLSQFLDECLLTMQIARAAVMYLILFVDSQEKRLQTSDAALPILGTPVDSTFRWVPSQGD